MQLEALETRVRNAVTIIGPEQLEVRVDALEAKTLAEGFWDDQAAAQSVMTDMTALKEDLKQVSQWRQLSEDARVALEFAAEEAGV